MAVKVVSVQIYGTKDFKFSLDDSHYVYCGRPSKYGNPYIMRNESERNLVIEKFKNNVLPKLDLSELIELAKTGDLYLGCFCVPKRCHCDEIKAVIDSQL